MYDIYDSYKPDINDDNISSVSSWSAVPEANAKKSSLANSQTSSHYSNVNNDNEIVKGGSVKSNHTLNIDPNEINYNDNPLSETNLKSEEKKLF